MKHLAFIFFFSCSITVIAQSPDPVDSLVKRFDDYRKHALQEKIYAHLDRNFYLTGETMWFKLYNIDGTFNKPINLSKVAYVEILDKSNFPVLRTKVGLQDGTGNGSFFLPASLTSGNYRLRAYTSWMKNFPPEFYYCETIAIVNPFIVPESDKREARNACGVEFFPEGGNLVEGVRSKVAFRITSNHQPEACKATLLNAGGDTLASLSPGKNGMGHFYLTPYIKEKYTVVVSSGTGKISQQFPAVHPSGVVMHLRDTGDVLRVTATARGIADESLYLFAHARHMIIRAQATPLQNNQALFLIKKADLPPGISHLTVFNEKLQPLCERLYFTYPDREMKIDISTNQKTYASRKKVTVSLQTTTAGANAKNAKLSMAVYRLDSLTTKKDMTIYPYLWLASELAGLKLIPSEYFKRDRSDEMDQVMLTHGWRRFDWNEVLNERKQFEFLPEIREHIVTGVVKKGEQPQRGVFTYLGSPGKIIRAYGSWSNANGEVRFEIKDFYGPRRIILQADADSTENYHIVIKDPFSSSLPKEHLPLFALQAESRAALVERSIAMQVQDIYYYDKYGEQVIPPLVDSTAFYGPADNTYYLDDYTRFPVMEEVMREYVPGVFVRKRKDGFHFIVIDDVNGGVLTGDPMVLLDGVPILDVDDIMRMDPLRIKKLEVVKRQYYLGNAVFSGIVSYTTYNGDLSGMELDPRSITLDYDGLQLQRQFHRPEYSRESQLDRMPDQRHLLHWEPDITTNDSGQEQLEFYTSDVPGQYIIVVEGIDHKGYSGTATFPFTVSDSDTQ